MVLLGAFTVITALSWVMRPPGDAFIAYLYPVFCAILVAFLIGLWRYPAALPRLEMAMFAFGMAAVLARLAWHLYGPADIEAQLLPLVGGHYWSIGVLIIAAFFVFERHAVLVGGAVLIFSGVITASGLAMQARDAPLPAGIALFLLRIHLFLLIYLLLGAVIAGIRGQLREVHGRMRILDSAAHTDVLTGVANRRAGAKLLKQHCRNADQSALPLSVLLIDIDEFKPVNDEYGHDAGDQLLVALAQRLRAQLRASDTLVRWGGDEFLILAPGADHDDAYALAERCRETVARTPVAGHALTISLGGRQYRRDEGPDTLLARVDKALYASKSAGRNSLAFA